MWYRVAGEMQSAVISWFLSRARTCSQSFACIKSLSFHSDAERDFHTQFTNGETQAEWWYKLTQITSLSCRARIQSQGVWYPSQTILTMSGWIFLTFSFSSPPPQSHCYTLSLLFPVLNVSLTYNLVESRYPILLCTFHKFGYMAGHICSFSKKLSSWVQPRATPEC